MGKTKNTSIFCITNVEENTKISDAVMILYGKKKQGAKVDVSQRQPFTEKVISVIRSIPRGKISSYGRVAERAGNKSAARQVARILHSCSEKEDLPWHRVVNREGCIVLPQEQAFFQKMLLEDEGVQVSPEGKISLRKYLWK